MKMVLATRNKSKVTELRAQLAGLDIEVLTLEDFPSLELPPETGATFTENALIKARFVASETGLAALGDDSGLEVDYLGGRPGVFSSRYGGPDAGDVVNYMKLLAELRGVPEAQRGARFKCSLAFVAPGGEERVFTASFDGYITERPRGENGFGYDPVFFVTEKKKTAAELTPREKNAISHRALALKKFRQWFSGGGAENVAPF
ncbi:MAG: XTP/dITP diphosphatase [Thermodesulfobacteriota bacterium]